MQRQLVVEFSKMNGAGNDFIVIDNRFFNFSDEELAALAWRYCPRRTGIGADGLLALARPRQDDHHFRMRYVNADGSLGTMCGNGARCLARFARQGGIQGAPLVFETDAGVYQATAPHDEGLPVRLFVHAPERWQQGVALAARPPDLASAVHYLWTGTEHLLCPVEDVESVPVERWGPALRRDPALPPPGANVDFVDVRDPGGEDAPSVLRVRTFEKGVEAETLACGTGALAAAVGMRLLDRIASETVQVEMPGGTLGVGFRLEDGAVRDLYLEGPAVSVYRGTFYG